MLTDPQSVTLSGTATSLPRLEERADTHVYANRDAKLELFVTQKVDKKTNIARGSTSLVQTVNVTDPITGLISRARPAASVSLAIPEGVTSAQVEALYDALVAALGASTKALLKKILGGEK